MGLPLPDGSQITDWDDQTIGVTGSNGLQLRVARSAAPAYMESAISAAAGAGVQSVGAPSGPAVPNDVPPPPAPASPAAPVERANPFSFVEGAPPITGQVTTPEVQAPSRLHKAFETIGAPQPAPVAAGPAPTAAAGPSPQDDLANLNAQIGALRAMPQTARTGGGVRTSTTRSGYDPETIKKAEELQTTADAAADEAQKAREEQAAAEQKSQAKLADVAGQQAQRLDKVVQQQAADQQDYTRRFDAELSKLQDLQKAAKVDIDPKRWWKQSSTGENILSAIAIGLGAAGAVLGRVPNFALEIIDKSIQRDIDAQMANRDSKSQAARDQGGILALVGDKYATKEQQRQAAIAVSKELAATQIEQVGFRSTSDQVRAKASEMAAQVRGQAAKDRQALVLQLAGQVTTQEVQVPGTVGKSPAAQAADALAAATYAKFDPEALVPEAERITGVPMQAIGGKAEATELNKTMASSAEFLRKLDQMEALGKNKLSPAGRTSMKSLRAMALLDIKNLAQAGALDAGMQEIANEALGPNQTDITTVTTAIPTLRTTVRAQLRGYLKNRAVMADPNAVPLTMRSRYSPTGNGAGAAPPPTRPLAESP